MGRSTSRKLLLGLFCSLCLPVIYAAPLISTPDQIKSQLAGGTLNAKQIPNPHWKKDSCLACHLNEPATRGNIRNFEMHKLCGNCHNPWSKASFNHPTGMTLPRIMANRMPDSFRASVKTLGGNLSRKVNCLTCHDLIMQCLESRKEEKFSNPLFLRTGPFRDRVELCFYCHKSKSYNRYNPHKQIVNGKLNKKNCGLCHKNVKRLNSDTKLSDIKLRSEKDLTKLCTNCHPWRPHPGWEMAIGRKKHTNHLVKPSRAMQVRMGKMQREMGIALPLEGRTKKITCSTCHNPHEKGVINAPNLKTGANNPQRLRIVKSCSFCHEI